MFHVDWLTGRSFVLSVTHVLLSSRLLLVLSCLLVELSSGSRAEPLDRRSARGGRRCPLTERLKH